MFGLRKKISPPVPDEIAGIRVRPSRRARRLALRVDARTGDVVLTWPPGANARMAADFIEMNHDWIAQKRTGKRRLPPLAEGGTLSVLGREYTIVRGEGRGLTRFDGASLIVHGRPEHLSRRIRDFLKERARETLSAAVAEKLETLGLRPAPIRIADPRSRWGSCGPDGRMMFSWRLILMPPEVLDYVVAHEAAHRVHLNHGRKFWTLCASLTGDAAGARRWLRSHGGAIMALA